MTLKKDAQNAESLDFVHTHTHTHTHTSKHCLEKMVTAGTGLIFGAVLLTSFSSLAGGSIFKSHKTRTYNPDGVSSVGVYVCGSLECPPVRIVEGDCDTVPNATKKFGVCVCNEGFVAHGEKCKSLCEATPIENCATCEIQGGQPTCTTCQDGYYLWNNQCLSCSDAKAKTCDEEGASTTCVDGYEVKDGTCVESVNVDVGVCDNGNVYLSYNSDPCGTETPMEGKTCTSDADCYGGSWGTDNTGCCDTSLSKCKSWIFRRDVSAAGKEYYICPEENRRCKKNSDCASGEFCNLVSNEGDCEKPDTGMCMPIGDSTAHTYINGTTKTFWTSPAKLSWWGAENWCKAQGKSLVSYATLHDLFDCSRDIWSCTGDKFMTASNWQDGQTLTDDTYWTAESYSSCYARYVDVNNSALFIHDNRIFSRYALCE